MKRRPTPAEQMAGAVLAFVLGLAGAFALMHFAACEQDDRVCAFTGVPSK
jgi:hypothetical protein